VPFRWVERLVGRLCNLAQVVLEAGPHMRGLYRLQGARQRQSRISAQAGGHRHRLKKICIQGETESLVQYQASLTWWSNALQRGVRVPLAVPRAFPALRAPGCAAHFGDAARECGTGAGGFMVLQRADGETFFLWSSALWPEDIGDALRADVLSMPAGELGTLVALVPAFTDAALSLGMVLTHLLCFTDSVATRAAVNQNSSGSPQLNFIVRDRFQQLDSTSLGRAVQLQAVHVPGVLNCAADNLSRILGVEDVLRRIREARLTPVRVAFPDRGMALLRSAKLQPHRYTRPQASRPRSARA